jgi:mannose-6-phosphate isomerase-like protein (cupin superfamily)
MQLDEAHAVLLGPGEGETTRTEERTIFVKGSWESMDFLEYEGSPDYEGAGPHFHKRHTDSFYVLEGELEFRIGNETHRAGPGGFVSVPPGTVHAFTNPGPGPVRFLNVHAPPCGFTDYIRAVDRGEDVDPERFDIWETEQGGEADAVLLGPREGELIPGRNRELRVKVSRDEVDALEFFDCEPEFGPVPPHVHDDQIDSFYVLEGELEFQVEGESVRAGPRTYVAVPIGVVHGFSNPGPARARFLNVHAPAAGFIDSLRPKRST